MNNNKRWYINVSYEKHTMKMHCVLFILKKGLQSVQKVCIIIFVVEREISQSTKHNGRLAQLGEHLPYKQGVTGSIPVTSIGRMV